MEVESLKSLVIGALEDLKAVNTVSLDVASMTDVMVVVPALLVLTVKTSVSVSPAFNPCMEAWELSAE